MFKEDRCVRLGQNGVCLRQGGGNCLKYLKRGWNRKEGRGNKNFKMKWGQAWSIDESLIRVRVKFFLQTMAYNPLGPLLNALLTYSCVNTYSCSNFEKWNVTLILIC